MSFFWGKFIICTKNAYHVGVPLPHDAIVTLAFSVDMRGKVEGAHCSSKARGRRHFLLAKMMRMRRRKKKPRLGFQRHQRSSIQLNLFHNKKFVTEFVFLSLNKVCTIKTPSRRFSSPSTLRMSEKKATLNEKRDSAPRFRRHHDTRPVVPHLQLPKQDYIVLDDVILKGASVQDLVNLATDDEIYAKYLHQPLSAPVDGRSASLVPMCPDCGARSYISNFKHISAWICSKNVDNRICGRTWFNADTPYKACGKEAHESRPECHFGVLGTACPICEKFVALSSPKKKK
jgi:hypothetical protein